MAEFLPTLEAWQAYFNFQTEIAELSKEIGVDLKTWQIDHVAIRVNSEKEALAWRDALLEKGRVLSQKDVNGRPIYLIKLNEPLDFLGQAIFVVELPFPKKIRPTSGWDHIEIVVPFLVGETIPAWQTRVLGLFSLQNRADLSLKFSQPQAKGEQKTNPTFTLARKDKSTPAVRIKIHPMPIEEIIE